MINDTNKGKCVAAATEPVLDEGEGRKSFRKRKRGKSRAQASNRDPEAQRTLAFRLADVQRADGAKIAAYLFLWRLG